MKLTWRSGLLAVTGAVALIGAVACGESEESTTTSAATTAPAVQQAATATATPEDPRAGWPDVIRLGYFGGDDADEVLERNEPHRKYLEETLGVPVEIFTGTSYGAVIEAMRAGRVEGMQVGPFAYVLAVQEAGAEAIAVGISCSSSQEVCTYDPERAPHYFSVVMTKKGNGIESLEDLRGKEFAFVDAASASGHLAPKTYLIQNGIDPDVDMTTVFAGSHPSAVLALQNDNVPASATHENNLLTLINEGQIEACFWDDGIANRTAPRTAEEIQAHFDACPDGNIVIIGQTAPIPSTPFAVRSDLPDSLKDALRDAYLATADMPEQVEVDRRWYVDPTEELGLDSLDQYYNSLRDIARLLDLDLKELAES
jgi:phosphonate transport system substrate-binding protein